MKNVEWALRPSGDCWCAYVAIDGSGCYSRPHRVRVHHCDADGVTAHVHERTGRGTYRVVTSKRLIKTLFRQEADAWLYLAGQLGEGPSHDYCLGVANRCRLTESPQKEIGRWMQL